MIAASTAQSKGDLAVGWVTWPVEHTSWTNSAVNRDLPHFPVFSPSLVEKA